MQGISVETLRFMSELAFQYKNKFNGSTAINTLIAQTLGPELYVKFCVVMDDDSKYNKEGVRSRKFSKLFLKNPVEDADILKDDEIAQNFSLYVLVAAIHMTVKLTS